MHCSVAAYPFRNVLCVTNRLEEVTLILKVVFCYMWSTQVAFLSHLCGGICFISNDVFHTQTPPLPLLMLLQRIIAARPSSLLLAV